MRRASTPAICLTATRAVSPSRLTVQRSFSSDASGRYAAMNRPAAYSTFFTNPPTGARFTCTSSGDRKIETRTAWPTHGSTCSTTAITRPSAGASTAPGRSGGVRSGSRKKPRKASEATAKTVAAPHQPIQAMIHAAAAGGRMNGHPSEATGTRKRDSAAPAASLARRLDPGHHLAQPAAHLLDRMVGVALSHGEEAGAVRLVLEHPLACELTGLDLGEDLLHLSLGPVVDDARPAGVVAILRGVRDRVAHVGEAALVEQVHDQLHLVHALEVRDLGLVPGVDQRLVGGLDQVRHAAAEGGLLAEEVGLGLFLEGGFDDSGAGAAHALAVGEGEIAGLARDVLIDRDQPGHPRALGEEVAHHVPGRLGRDHRDVHVGGRHHLVEVDVEAVGEHQHLAFAEHALYRLLEHLPLGLVGQQDHHDVAGRRRVVDGGDLEPVLLGPRPALGALVEADHHVLPGVLEVERVGVALAAVADDGDGLAPQQTEVCVLVV